MDIDECEKSLCGPHRNCRDHPAHSDRLAQSPGYTCLPGCHDGYTNVTEDECEDINECELDNHGCIGQADVCRNLPGTYRCECIDGFVRDVQNDCVGEYSDVQGNCLGEFALVLDTIKIVD